MPIDLICLDADDTLWHNMRHFHATEDALVAMVEPFADAGIARSALEACEIRNLKLFGYGAKAFTLSMIETSLELVGEDVPASVIRNILEAGKALHAHPVELFEGIEETLNALADRARLVLVTKGDLFHQEAKLAASGLGDRFSGIEIFSDIRPATFIEIFERYGVEPSVALMAGD
jgi:putative hydrolase of the HAD superfamily